MIGALKTQTRKDRMLDFARPFLSQLGIEYYIETVSEPCGVAMEPQTPPVEGPVQWWPSPGLFG